LVIKKIRNIRRANNLSATWHFSKDLPCAAPGIAFMKAKKNDQSTPQSYIEAFWQQDTLRIIRAPGLTEVAVLIPNTQENDIFVKIGSGKARRFQTKSYSFQPASLLSRCYPIPLTNRSLSLHF